MLLKLFTKLSFNSTKKKLDFKKLQQNMKKSSHSTSNLSSSKSSKQLELEDSDNRK